MTGERSDALDRDAARTFLDFLYDAATGFACVASKAGRWHEEFFEWPQQKETLLDFAMSLALTADVYLGVLLYVGGRRRASDALAGRRVWIDVDADPGGAAWRWIENAKGELVRSGSPDHFHGYLSLREPIDAATLEGIAGALTKLLRGDSKQSASTVLRLPGTLNYKHDPPAPVTWVPAHLDFEGYELPALGELLGTSSLKKDSAPTAETRADPKPTPRVQRLLGVPPGPDRSVQTAALVYAAVEDGMHDEEILALAKEHAPSVEKYGPRLDDEVRRIIRKHRPKHDHVGSSCEAAGCTGKPPRRGRSVYGRLMTNEELERLPDPEPLIEGILMLDTVAVLFGPPAHFKSFVVQDLSLAIASGIQWQGLGTRSGAVLYVAGEGTAALKLRLRAWQLARMASADAMLWLPGGADLRGGGDIRELLEVAQEHHPVLIVIDTFARSMLGGDENSAKDVGLVIDRADQLREAGDGATVMFVHHTTKDGLQLRGSSALLGAADTVIECKREGNVITLRCTKQKDALEFAPLYLEARPVAPSLVLERAAVASVDSSAAPDALVIFHDFFGAGPCPLARFRDAYAQETGRHAATAYRAIERLKREGLMEDTGRRYEVRLTDAGRAEVAARSGRLFP